MKPVYFPFTYVSDSVAEAVTSCFGPFVLYRPVGDIASERMQLLIQSGVVEVRPPPSGNDEALKTAVKNYQSWAELYQDHTGKTAFLKSRMNPVPLLSELSSTRIVADIKSKDRSRPVGELPDPDLFALIFLYFAQEFDRQNQELSDGLNHHEQLEAELIDGLKMEDDPIAEELRKTAVHQPEPPADYMISDRMEAWARLFCRAPQDSGLFVTHSPAVMAYLLDRIPTAERLLHLESVPRYSDPSGAKAAFQENLAGQLTRFAETGQADPEHDWTAQLILPAADRTASLSVYLVPDLSPGKIYARFAEMNFPAAVPANGQCRYRNTLIALIEI